MKTGTTGNYMGERIKRRREELGLTQEDVATHVGCHVVNVSRWETGARGINGPNLSRLANVLGVTRSWLLEESPPPDFVLSTNGKPEALVQVKRTPRPKFESPAAGADSDEWVDLPAMEAAAGVAGIAMPHQVSYLRFNRSFLRGFGDPSTMGTAFAVGDSMLPGIANGDMALVKAGRDEWKQGGVMLVRVDDGLLLKRVQVMHDGVARLLSDNPLFPPIEVRMEDGGFDVIGRVVWVAGRV